MRILKLFSPYKLNRPSGRMAFIGLIYLALLTAACSPLLAAQPAASGGIPATGATPLPSPTMQMEMNPTGMIPTNQPQQVGLKAYIGLFKDNAVAVLDTSTNQVLRKISVPAGPHGLVITPDGRWLYVSSDGDSKVSVIDTTLDKVVDTIEVGKSPHGLAITPDGGLILVAVFGTSQVVYIDNATHAILGSVDVPNPHNIAISPDGQTAYVAAQKPGKTALAILNIDKLAQTGSIPLAKTPRALNFSPDGKLLYFTLAGVDAVQALDPVTNQITAQIPVGASPHHPLFTPNGQSALVVSQGPGQLSILDPKANTVRKVVAVGKMPHWIAVNPQGTTAWVTNEASNNVSVVDLTSGTVTATIPVGNAPRKLVIQPQAISVQPEITPESTPGSSGAAISISGQAFMPTSISVKSGQTITWTNNDSITHTVTSDDAQWDSGNLDPGKSFSLTLSKPGQYSYHCSIHPFMQGTITVTQ